MSEAKRMILDLEIEVEARQCAADDAIALLRYWKSMMHPAAWVCWTPETCGEARVDGEAGSCPTCLVDAFLTGTDRMAARRIATTAWTPEWEET